MSSIAVDLHGCEIRYRSSKYETRAIEYGQGKPLILMPQWEKPEEHDRVALESLGK